MGVVRQPQLSLIVQSGQFSANMFQYLLSFCLFGLALAGEIPIQDCGSKGTIEKIVFDGCDAFPCTVHHGEHATGKLSITASAAAESLTCKITGIIAGGIELPFNGCPLQACEHLDEEIVQSRRVSPWCTTWISPSKTSSLPSRSRASG